MEFEVELFREREEEGGVAAKASAAWRRDAPELAPRERKGCWERDPERERDVDGPTVFAYPVLVDEPGMVGVAKGLLDELWAEYGGCGIAGVEVGVCELEAVGVWNPLGAYDEDGL